MEAFAWLYKDLCKFCTHWSDTAASIPHQSWWNPYIQPCMHSTRSRKAIRPTESSVWCSPQLPAFKLMSLVVNFPQIIIGRCLPMTAVCHLEHSGPTHPLLQSFMWTKINHSVAASDAGAGQSEHNDWPEWRRHARDRCFVRSAKSNIWEWSLSGAGDRSIAKLHSVRACDPPFGLGRPIRLRHKSCKSVTMNQAHLQDGHRPTWLLAFLVGARHNVIPELQTYPLGICHCSWPP